MPPYVDEELATRADDSDLPAVRGTSGLVRAQRGWGDRPPSRLCSHTPGTLGELWGESSRHDRLSGFQAP